MPLPRDWFEQLDDAVNKVIADQEQRSSNSLVASLRTMARICASYSKVASVDVQKMAKQAADEIERLQGELRLANSLYAHEGHAKMVLMEELSKLRSAEPPKASPLRVWVCSEEYGCNLEPGEYYLRQDVDPLLARAAEPPKETHPMLTVLTICDAYESGMGQGLANRTFDNPYDPVNDPHAYRAYGHGYDEGVKRRHPSTKESSLGDEHACGECGHIECRSAHETSSPRWKRADKLWSEYPIGTVARQSWTGCKWTKNERGWKAHAGDTFPIPGGADEVAVSEQGEPTADETSERPGFRKLTDAVIAEMRWTCAHGITYERWLATAACGCDRPALSENSTL